MLTIKYINENGKYVEMGGKAPYFFLSQEGMDGVDAIALMTKAPFQKGKTHLGVNIDERLVTIKGSLVTESLEEQYRLRRELISIISPISTGALEIFGQGFERMFSSVQIIDGPNFDDRDYNVPDGIVYFDFSMAVPNNFLEDLEFKGFMLVEVEPSFEFVLEFDEPIEFGNMTHGRISFNNTGDVPAPIVIEIPGYVKTPVVTNLTTGEYIKINTPILSSETMIINTSFGNKSVFIVDGNGNKRNGFHYIDLGSVFFQLAVGENVLSFGAEEGNDTANVTFKYKRLYLGI